MGKSLRVKTKVNLFIYNRMNETLLKHQKDYQTAQVELKKLVQENEGPEIREKKVKERVEWID